MKTNKISLAVLIVLAGQFSFVFGQSPSTITLQVDQARNTISRDIYGHFSEHLGRCIYDGLWVGENSLIPNTRGIRNDVVQALREIQIPNLRWPGGCFADTYHWMDGIGPKDKRPHLVNSNWGGVVEDNSFGTHEFMDLCGQLECEPVICGNIGSGTVKEMADWVEYLTSGIKSPITDLRKQNGREDPWKVKFWGIGNETWGCGGVMSADFYANEFSRYSLFLKNYGNNVLYKISSGGLESDYDWTETVMKKWSTAGEWLQPYLGGYSLHYYTVCNDWSKKGSATDFNEEDWFVTLSKTLHIEELIARHSVIMDKYDSSKKIGLIVDEWGNWHDVEPGTNPGFLYQQNTLRDAMVAAVNLNIFNNHCDRVKMANIAQIVNVLQALILTKDDKMILTPTYHVFNLYKVHHDALQIPIEINCEDYELNGKKIPAVNVSASKDKNGLIHVSVVNINPDKSIPAVLSVKGANVNTVTGSIITASEINAMNSFDKTDVVKPVDFDKIKIEKGILSIQLPAKSILVLELK